MKRKTKVLILEGTIASYMLPIYEQLSNEIDLNVMFCAVKMKGRLWLPRLEKHSFNYEVLKNFSLGPFVINPTLPFKLLFHNYDILYLMDAPRHIFSQSLALMVTKLLRRKIVIGSVIHHNTRFPIYTSWFISPEKSNLLSTFLEGIARGLLNAYRKIIYRSANIIVALSNKTKEYVLKLGIPQNKIFTGAYVMPETLLYKKSDYTNQKFKDKKIILCVSYFKKYKGIDYLIRTFKSLERNDAALMIMGTGEEEEKLKSLAAGGKNILFLGYLDGEEKARYYSIADIFIHPTLYDSWGLIINEAMYYGLPIITTDAAGATDIIRGNGIVIEAGNESQLRQAIENLLDNDELRKEMAIRSREIIKNYDTRYMVNFLKSAIEHAYQSV